MEEDLGYVKEKSDAEGCNKEEDESKLRMSPRQGRGEEEKSEYKADQESVMGKLEYKAMENSEYDEEGEKDS